MVYYSNCFLPFNITTKFNQNEQYLQILPLSDYVVSGGNDGVGGGGDSVRILYNVNENNNTPRTNHMLHFQCALVNTINLTFLLCEQANEIIIFPGFKDIRESKSLSDFEKKNKIVNRCIDIMLHQFNIPDALISDFKYVIDKINNIYILMKKHSGEYIYLYQKIRTKCKIEYDSSSSSNDDNNKNIVNGLFYLKLHNPKSYI